jgi:Spy/CpxP family protein refolding chaperone
MTTVASGDRGDAVNMSISTLIGTRLLTGIGALALVGSLAGGTAVAAKGGADKPGNALRHELRDQTKTQRDEIKDLRKQLASEYAKDQPDVAKMKQLHARIEAQRDAIEALRFGAFLDMHDQLDADQRERIAARIGGKGKHGEGKANKGERNKGKRDAKADKGERNKGKREAKAAKGERNKG